MNIRRLFSSVYCYALAVILLALTGCLTTGEMVESRVTDSPQPTGISPVRVETSVATVELTPTPALPASSPTPVTTPEALPTSSPTTTLTSVEKGQQLAELMRTNEGCELPCWWGIVLGETPITLAMENLTAKGVWWQGNYASIRVADDLIVSLQFELEDDIIQLTQVGSSNLGGEEGQAFTRSWQSYSLAEVLKRQGIPSRVLVYHPFQFDPGSGPAFHLLIFYEREGIVIEYIGGAEQLDRGRYRACPDLSTLWDINLLLYQAERISGVVERVLPPDSISHIAGPDTVYERISWEQVTGTGLQFFHDTFSTPGNEACFDFSAG